MLSDDQREFCLDSLHELHHVYQKKKQICSQIIQGFSDIINDDVSKIHGSDMPKAIDTINLTEKSIREFSICIKIIEKAFEAKEEDDFEKLDKQIIRFFQTRREFIYSWDDLETKLKELQEIMYDT